MIGLIQASKTRTTTIGIQGENKARVIAFDVSDILAEFPGASFTLIHQRSGDTSAYPVGSTELHGTMLLWTVTSADTAIAGSSYCELIATVDDVVKKTVIYSLRVAGTLDNSATPPDPWESWVQDVVDAADRADAAAALLENPGAQAETLETGSSATASYADGVFTFGIPRGAKGDPGQDGKDGKDGEDGTNGTNGRDGTDGADGFSPSASVSKSGNTATISITDKTGTTTAQISDGTNGTNGQDGFSPSASVSKVGDTATITITDKDGTTTAQVKDGASASGVQWELIKSGTETFETASPYNITVDDNGNAFALTDVLFVLDTPQQATQAELGSYGRIYFYYDTSNYETAYVGSYTQTANASGRSSSAIITQENGLRRMGYFINTTEGGDGPELNHANNVPSGKVDGLLVCTERTYSKVQIGSILGTFKYRLYGRRKKGA